MTDEGLAPITWTTEKRKIRDLDVWDRNPRRSDSADAQRIEESIDEFGYSQLLEIEPDGTLIDGHQRTPVLEFMEAYGPDAEIEMRVASRKLTDDERRKYVVLKHEGATGDWDYLALEELYSEEEMVEWGMSDHTIDIVFPPTEEPKPKPINVPGRFNISPELFERHDYVVFLFDNEMDWNVASDGLGLGTVKNAPVQGKTVDQQGLGRVLPGARLVELIVDAS